jgi:DNA-binding GntR family transcriptional regulator
MQETNHIESVSPVRSSSKSSEVFEALRLAILSRKLLPGDALKEAHVARQMHVSQVPVREALLQLENLGLVRRVPDTGTTVTKLTRTEMVELVQIRAHLEDLAFRLAAKRITPEFAQRLRKSAKEISRSASADDYYAAAKADLEFHRTVWQASGNVTLEKTLEKLCTAFYAFVSQQRRYAGEHLKDTLRQHEVLIDALLSKKASTISAAVNGHINEKSCIPNSIPE